MYKVRTTTITVVSILTIAFSVLMVCGSAAYIAGGVGFKTMGDPSAMSTLTASGAMSPTDVAQLQAQLNEMKSELPPGTLDQYGSIFTIVGLIGIVLYFAMFILGIGLWTLKRWGYFGVMVVIALHAIFSSGSAVAMQNFGILNMLEIAISVGIILALVLDKSTSRQFMGPPPDNFGMDRL